MGTQNSHTNLGEAPTAAKEETRQSDIEATKDDDEPDEWDKRILSTGCADENMKMTDCYFEKKDWRSCTKEMEAFKECWKQRGNHKRTATKDV